MDAIEFLEHTRYRNFKSQVKFKVQEKLRRLNAELLERSLKLRHILELENLKYAEELAKTMQTRIEEAARKRHEYFGIHRMERQIEIDKFLQLKKPQREMENCEETRHKQSKALLLDTKQGQLYQIKEKEMMRQKERDIEKMWVEVTRRYNEEMIKQNDLERKLVKTIADISEKCNLRYNECQKERNRICEQDERAECAQEDANACLMDKFYHTQMKTLEKNKKLKQQQLLLQQIEQNQKNRNSIKQSELKVDLELNRRNHAEALNCHYDDAKKKIHEAVWQEHYINHVRQEAQRKRKESEKFHTIFLGTGCVLQQRNKIPYNKSAR